MSSTQYPKKIGKYEVLSLLGRGGMGVVYKGRDPDIDRVVAIKTISTSEAVQEGEEYLITRLKMEARSAGRLQHPNIVTVYDFGEQEEMAFIVMEFVEGMNLGRMIAQKRPMSLAKKVDLLIQIANGLAYAHEYGVVHRDMKPANVCVTSKDVAKILDFGLARFDTTRLTKTGFLSGTLAYMAPERLKGKSGMSDDIFALGAIAYELLTYHPCFAGETPPEVIYNVMSTTPEAPSAIADLPPELDAIIMQGIEKDPQHRYASAAEFASKLQDFRHSSAFRNFISDDRRTAELEHAMKTFVDVERPGIHPYSAAAMTPAKPKSDPELLMPTEMMPAIAPETTQIQEQPTVREFPMAGPSTDRELDFSTQAIGAPTVKVRQPGAPRRMLATIGIAAIAVVAIVVALGRNKDEVRPAPRPAPPASAEKQPIPATTATTAAVPQTPATDDARDIALAQAEWSELNRRISEKLFAATREGVALSDSQKSRLGKRVASLRSEVQRGRSEVIREEGEAILRAYDQALRAPAPARPVQVPQETRKPVEAEPEVPAPVVVAPAIEPPAPAKPVEDPRREIAAFIQRMAAAYQNRDAAFFRDNYLRYSEQLGKAIRSSPSVRVEIEVVSIELKNASTAVVTATRTDTFSNDGAQPAVQRLVYELARTASGWKLAAFRKA